MVIAGPRASALRAPVLAGPILGRQGRGPCRAARPQPGFGDRCGELGSLRCFPETSQSENCLPFPAHNKFFLRAGGGGAELHPSPSWAPRPARSLLAPVLYCVPGNDPNLNPQ